MKSDLRPLGWILTASLLAFCGFNIHHSFGFVGATRKPGATYAGCICHSDTSSSAVRVLMTGPDSLGLGDFGIYTVAVIKDSSIAAGFNVATFFGLLTVGDSSEQQWMDGELTHVMPKLSSGVDTISWTFLYQAPEFSTVDTLYATGNSVDLSEEPFGDYWNFSQNFPVRVGGPASVRDVSPIAAHRLYQNYPNPFNPSTRISYSLAQASYVKLTVFDILGRRISALVDRIQQPGTYGVEFDAGSVTAGIYLYRLETAGGIRVKKMVVLK